MKILSRLWPRAAPAAAIPDLPPYPGPIYVIGDVHGCLDVFVHLEQIIAKDAAQFAHPPQMILLGDLIDRGPQSAALLDHLILRKRNGPHLRILMGNHEEMMLAFVSNPKSHAAWLDFGGLETLASYGIRHDSADFARLSARAASHLLQAHIPPAHLQFLGSAALGLRIGGYLLAHAGADPRRPLMAQSRRALLWGQMGQAAPNGLTLIHGHTIVDQPFWSQGRIALDTGAYATGRLSALRLMDGLCPAYATTNHKDEFADLHRQGESPT